MGAATLTLYDETATGERSNPIRLTLASERIRARELIERKVRQEVEAYNRSPAELFYGLVAPTEAERSLNGFRMRKRRTIDPEEQCQLALEAFERNGFFMLVGDHQVESPDELIVVTPGLEVRFVKLVPLVGG